MGDWFPQVGALLASQPELESARRALYLEVSEIQRRYLDAPDSPDPTPSHVVRDCARALRSMLTQRADSRAGFGVLQALCHSSREHHGGPAFPLSQPSRPLIRAFWAELTQLFLGLYGWRPGL